MTTSARPRTWTRLEYERLIEIGVFRAGEPVELLGGQLIVSEPQGSAQWLVRIQGPIALDDESEPEPDIAAVPGRARDYSRAHPVRPVLVVEVADTSLAHDREHKGSLYARARVDDYWIVNLIERVLEVYRQPIPDSAAPFGWRYASREVLGPQSSVAPLVVADARIVVSDLLP